MIPVTLQVSNFLSYGKDVPALDFTRFNIACLSGGNGQGKSALLDALTWALWGEGRKAQTERKADRGLLKVGEKQMWVDLVFDLEVERYRVIRKFSLVKSRGISELEFMVYDSEKNEFISLSTPSLRQTQQKINGLLRMDYDTFINSAFILQGRVDEFTRKSARERKQILSEVLGLSRYEELSILARRHFRELDKELNINQSRLEQTQIEVAQKETVLVEIKIIKEQEQKQRILYQEKKEKLQKLEQEYSQLHFNKQQAEELIARLATEQKELQELKKRQERIGQNIKECQLFISQENKILADYDIYLQLARQNQEMLQSMEQYRKLEQEKREIGNRIENFKNRLRLELGQKQEKQKELTEKVNSFTLLQSEIKKLELQIANFNNLQKKKESIEEKGNALGVKIESKNDQIKRLEEENTDNKEKISLLEKGTQESCPLCSSPLDEPKKEKIMITLRQDIAKNRQEVGKLNDELKQLNQERNVLRKEYKRIYDELVQKDGVQNKLNSCYLLAQEVKKANVQMKELEPVITNLQVKIREDRFALSERKKWSEIEAVLKKHVYNDEKYLNINRELGNLRGVPLQRDKLLEAKKSLLKLDDEKTAITKQHDIKKKSINELRKSQEILMESIARISDVKQEVSKEKEFLEGLEKEQNQLLLQIGAGQEKLDKIEQFEQEQKEIEKTVSRLSYQKDIYGKLTNAFGKNGIPSMIIENAIPELEEEANTILAKLSDEPITISLESLKELQSGEMRETLDIKILDEMGDRPYELYSGGEAFRIDFAIRLALSKLLTQRSGARLRTLVIDEGFGTQDEEGLQKLIQAINAIQHDFDKILVITHLALLKDAFPVRIEVWKDPVLGSQFQMVHL
ncbi:MAG: SMC family ATPase [Candidatus Atribacteria bacterium]|nr:SMC family ATPase [Candidatus Atribacteria bacterium]